jgi:hypothetical protein
MEASKRTVSVDRHEWVLASPAHYTEIEKAVAVAVNEQARAEDRGHQPTDIQVAAHDDEVIVYFEARRPQNPKRDNLPGREAGGTDG